MNLNYQESRKIFKRLLKENNTHILIFFQYRYMINIILYVCLLIGKIKNVIEQNY